MTSATPICGGVSVKKKVCAIKKEKAKEGKTGETDVSARDTMHEVW